MSAWRRMVYVEGADGADAYMHMHKQTGLAFSIEMTGT